MVREEGRREEEERGEGRLGGAMTIYAPVTAIAVVVAGVVTTTTTTTTTTTMVTATTTPTPKSPHY